MKISKLSRKKETCLNGEIFQVYMYKYACILLLLQDYLQSHGTATGRKMAVVFANIFMTKIERAILSQSNTTLIFWERFIDDIISIRGTQRIGSVKYLFGRPLIPSDFLKIIVTSNFRVCCFRIVKNVVLGTKKRSAIIFGKAIRPKVFGKWTKQP